MPTQTALEVNFRRDPSIYDGQFSNNGWLQELPKPLSKLTWDNAIQIGPKMAEREGLKSMDVVTLELNGTKVTGPVWIQAGHPDHSVTVNLGYGRRAAGRAGTGAGFDAYPLRTIERALDRNRREAHQDRRLLPARLHPGLPDHGHGRWRNSSRGPRSHARGISQGAEVRERRRAARRTHALSRRSTTRNLPTPGA